MSKSKKAAKEVVVNDRHDLINSFKKLHEVISEQTEEGIKEIILNSEEFCKFAVTAKDAELVESIMVLEIEHLAMFLYTSRLRGELDEEYIRKNSVVIRNRALSYLIKITKELGGNDIDNFPEIIGEEPLKEVEV